MKLARESEIRTHWRVLAGVCTLTLAAPIPIVIRPFSLYIEPWRTEFGWTTGQMSLAVSVFVWTLALCAPLLGWLADRYSTKALVRAFGTAYCIGLISVGRNTGNLGLFYVSFFCLGLSGLGISTLVYTKLLSQYFHKSLGAALACLMFATALSAIVTPVLVQRIMRAEGWRACWYCLAAAAFLDFLLMSARLPPPLHMAPSASRSLGAAVLRSREFRLLTGIGVLLAVMADTCSVHLVPLMREAGADAGVAGAGLAILGAGALVGRLGTGFLLDRRPAIEAVILGATSAVLGLVLLVVGGDGPALAGCYLLGQASGCEMDIVPYLIKQYYGAVHFGEVSGAMSAIIWSSAAGAVWLMGLSRDAMGSYKPMLLLLIIAAAPTFALTGMLFRTRPPTKATAPAGEPV